MELSNRDFSRLATASARFFGLVKAEQADMIAVFVVIETNNLIFQLLSFWGRKHLKTETMRQGNFLLQNIKSTINYDESELAVE